MLIRLIIIYFLTTMVPISGQWQTFDLSKANNNNFLKQTTPILISSVLSLGQPTLMNLSEKKRFGIAILFPSGWDATNISVQTNPHIFPLMAEGQILVSNNLVLKGKMNLLSPKDELVNAAGYGIEYLQQTWTTSVNVGWLEGSKYLKIRMIGFNILWKRILFEIPINLGVGHNNYRSIFLNLDEPEIPSTYKNSLTYFVLATPFHFKMFDVNVQTQIHSEFIQLNLQLLRSFF